ncbi:MAG: MalT-like region [Chthoniobacter sp.]|nr:MalT-like region [Chthoniobacter sp.]
MLLGLEAIAQAPAVANATFKVKGGTTGVQQGTVLGASAAGVKIQIGAQTLTLPPAMFESFQMAPPPEYALGYQAFTARDFSKALGLMKSVTDKYKGLPTEWAQYATGMLGDIYVETGDFTAAEAAYNEFKRLYQAPGTTSATSEVGLARIAVAKKDLSGAKARLDPITAEALKEKSPPATKALAYSKAFLVSGQIKEAEGNLPGALEDYLRTVTLFYHDRAAVAVAQEKADALRSRDKDHPVTVP